MLIQNAVHFRRPLRSRRAPGAGLRAAGVGHDRHRLSLRLDEVLVKFRHRLVEIQLLAVEAYPVVVVGSYAVGAPENVVDVVFLDSHSAEDRVCKRRPVLEDAAGEKVVYVRYIKAAAYGGYHQFLVFSDDVIGYLLVLRDEVLAYRRFALPHHEFQRERHLKRAVVDYSVPVCFQYNIFHLSTLRVASTLVNILYHIFEI